jgi:hypothetical protein
MLQSRPPLHFLVAGRELLDPVFIDYARRAGFHWARRVWLPWVASLRNPTVGCVVVLSRRAETAAVDIESAVARGWGRIIAGR